MNAPKYQTGQNVYFVASAVKHGAPDGAHRVERLMPADDGRRGTGRQYRLKAVDTGRERIAREDELSAQAAVRLPAALPRERNDSAGQRANGTRADGARTSPPWAQRDPAARDNWFKDALASLSHEAGEA